MTTTKRTKLQNTRDKGHNVIQTIIGWVFLPFIWIVSFFSGIAKGFIFHGRILSGGFLMVASALICIDNYYIILTKDSLISVLSGGLSALDPFYLIVAILAWVLVEYVQSKALRARQQQKATAQVVGMPSQKGVIFMGLIATILEGVSLVFGIWKRGGLSPMTIIVSGIGLFGYKIGFNWLSGGK